MGPAPPVTNPRHTIPILLYHGVGRPGAGAFAPYVIDPGRFAEHMAVIAGWGAATPTVSGLVALLDAGTLPERLAVVTFDDGFADVAEHALAPMQHHGIGATMYVCAGYPSLRSDWLDPSMRRTLMDDDTTRALPAAGVEVGSHAVTHTHLDLLPPDEAAEQIRASRHALRERLQLPIDSFAYPHGSYAARTRDAVVRAGYSSGCAVRNAYSHPGDDRFALARLTITDDVTPERLAALLEGRGARLAPSRELLRTKLGRARRRWQAERAGSNPVEAA